MEFLGTIQILRQQHNILHICAITHNHLNRCFDVIGQPSPWQCRCISMATWKRRNRFHNGDIASTVYWQPADGKFGSNWALLDQDL